LSPTTTLHSRGRFVVVHVRWPPYRRSLKLECARSYHLIEHSLVGRPETTTPCQPTQGRVSLGAMLHVSHASMLPQNVERASPVKEASLRDSPVERHVCCGGNADDHSPGPYLRPPCMHLCRLCLTSLASAQLLRYLLSWCILSSCEPPSLLGFSVLNLA